MTGTPSILVDLLAECSGHGIRLAPTDGGGLEIDAPQGALTPDLLARLKTHKGDLLGMLRPAPKVAPALIVATRDAPAKPMKPVCRCGSTTWLDVPIHGRQSVRRDCARCGRFIDFSMWYGRILDK
jgi:hypothetical protein